MKSSGFHEIHEIRWISPWNPADFTMKSDVSAKTSDFTRFGVDFMKSAGFHMKSTRFHEICWISYGFHEIHQISYGFHEIRRISCEIERPLQGIVTMFILTFWIMQFSNGHAKSKSCNADWHVRIKLHWSNRTSNSWYPLVWDKFH